MFDTEDLTGAMNAIDALRELSENTDQALIAARASDRLEIKTSVMLRPANSSARAEYAHETSTVDISDGGCMLLSAVPVMAGDLFWLEFSDEHIHVGSLFGRCMRCRMVSENVFEIGIKFMAPIDLQASINPSQ